MRLSEVGKGTVVKNQGGVLYLIVARERDRAKAIEIESIENGCIVRKYAEDKPYYLCPNLLKLCTLYARFDAENNMYVQQSLPGVLE